MPYRPRPGAYVIVNRVLANKGERLALTYNGKEQPVTVTPLSKRQSDQSQYWIIKDYDSKTQSISPFSDQKLQAGWGRTIVPLPANNYVWIIEGFQDYQIYDGDKKVKWSLTSPHVDAEVVPIEHELYEKQWWVFQPVGTPFD